ncbi:MAG: GIY-YIG nuclease family protein [Phormidesmis sp. CAN_BIN44]|nr:GIY-YIG nuclease family protein [Phormidesmis sp. CAN_BIN44]
MEADNLVEIEHQNVPQAHQGLHGFLYSSDDEHTETMTSAPNLGSQGDDIMSVAEWSAQAVNAKVAGVYAMLNRDRHLQYVGYSRNVPLSLSGHVTQVGGDACAFLRLKTFKFPKREEMEQLRDAWIAENNEVPLGNGEESDRWAGTVAEAAKLAMTTAERDAYEEKKLKLREATADQALNKELDQLSTSEADRRQNLEAAVKNDDWSAVIQQSQKDEG